MANYQLDPHLDRLNTDRYDNNGNTIQSGGVSDEYDFADRLIKRDGGRITLAYDGEGNRVRKTVVDPGTSISRTTKYLVDDQNPTGLTQVVEELDESGKVQRVNVWGQELLSTRLGENVLPDTEPEDWPVFYYGYDGFGNVRFLTGETGTVTDTYDYDTFGNILHQTGSTPNKYLVPWSAV